MKKIETIIKKAVGIVAKHKMKLYGVDVIAFDGVPEGEIWILGKSKIYKWTLPTLS